MRNSEVTTSRVLTISRRWTPKLLSPISPSKDSWQLSYAKNLPRPTTSKGQLSTSKLKDKLIHLGLLSIRFQGTLLRSEWWPCMSLSSCFPMHICNCYIVCLCLVIFWYQIPSGKALHGSSKLSNCCTETIRKISFIVNHSSPPCFRLFHNWHFVLDDLVFLKRVEYHLSCSS